MKNFSQKLEVHWVRWIFIWKRYLNQKGSSFVWRVFGTLELYVPPLTCCADNPYGSERLCHNITQVFVLSTVSTHRFGGRVKVTLNLRLPILSQKYEVSESGQVASECLSGMVLGFQELHFIPLVNG